MFVHQAVGMADPAKALHYQGQGGEESLPVFVVMADAMGNVFGAETSTMNESAYSARIPASFATLAHLAMSLEIMLRISAGVLMSTSAPSSVNRF
jgi:hypothetical protein